ncbi:ABC transporter ATP-binding protein [Pseudomonadota bacterium]
MKPEAETLSESMPTMSAKIWGILTPDRRRGAVKLWLLMVIGMVLEMMGVGLVIPVIALLTQQDLVLNYPILKNIFNMLGSPNQEALVVSAMLALVAVYLIKNLFLAFLIWQQGRFAFGLQAELSQRLFTIYLRQPYSFHLQRNSAQLVRNVQGEVALFINSAVTPGIQLLTEGLVFLGLGSLLMMVEPQGTLIVVAIMGLAAWGFQWATKKHVIRWGQARQYHDGKRIQHLHQGLGGAKDVKLLGRERDFLDQYASHAIKSTRMFRLQATLQQLPRLWLELLAVAGLAVLVLSMLSQGRGIDAILPTLGLFVAVAFRVLPTVNRILGAVQHLRYGLPAVDTLHGELNLVTPEQPGNQIRQGVPFQNELQLNDVSYTYPATQNPALDRISLTIQKGESVGFIGPSGSGKSTLADVILGLLLPNGGNIMLDGRNINNNFRAWQDQIGYVPQSIYLTDDTLRRNVAFGLSSEQMDEDAVWRAIQAAQLEEFVNSLSDGLDTVVGERGVRLSGGQRQRIGIARALYHDPAVLVLDEATSALDTATEADVMQAVTALQGSKTILIVAHRLSTVEHCDRLYRLEQGRVAAVGAPAEMIFTTKAALSS